MCDTIEDLDKLIESAKGSQKAQTNANPENQTELKSQSQSNGNGHQPKPFENSEPVQLESFVKGLTAKTKSFLSVVAESDRPLTDTELREKLNIEKKTQLLGTVSAIYKGAARLGINVGDILLRGTTEDGNGAKDYTSQIPDKSRDTIRNALRV